jgi:hypothetical protein
VRELRVYASALTTMARSYQEQTPDEAPMSMVASTHRGAR